MRILVTAVRMWLVALLALGLAYPLVITGMARVLMPSNAQGSLLDAGDGADVGSRLIGQEFESERYFHGRPSAAGAGYDPMRSGASNLGPASADLAAVLADRAEAAIASEPGLVRGEIPADMVTSSASGLDPDISPANALAQVPRVARARGLGEDDVRQLVMSRVTGRDLGFIGEPRVNVLELNIALDGIETQ